MLLEITDGTVSRGGSVILSHFNFYIKGTERIAIVGRNGAGKTTLLELLAGGLSLDIDEKHPDARLSAARAFTTGYLPQQTAEDPSVPIWQMLHGPGDDTDPDASGSAAAAADYTIRRGRMLKSLGFTPEDLDCSFGAFSGGQQRKLLLARLLLARPDVLIMDEPTNHLDLEAVQWLEQEVRQYPGAVVMVSHDRYFIDRTSDVVWEVSEGKLTRYPGNYTRYREERAAAYSRKRRAYEAQQEEIARQRRLIEQFKHKPRKAAFARSRAKMLERMDRIEKPVRDDAVIHTGDILPARASSRRVLSCDDLLIGYEQSRPVAKITLSLKRGQKIGIIGPNGSGKSTFLKTIAGGIPPLKGNVLYGSHVDIAYFDQMTAQISSDKSVMEWFHDRYPSLKEQEIRTKLAGYLFSSRHMGTPVSRLSGGEKSRLVLAALLETGPNLLLLDEPTNNMDIPAMETMESIFRACKGTILFVTHDRYFLSRVADSLMIFDRANAGNAGRRTAENAGERTAGSVSQTASVKYYPFDYAHYQAQKDRLAAGQDPAAVRSAEEQKLIDGLRAVPKKSYLPASPSTASEQLDWDYRLNADKVRQAEKKYLKAESLSEAPSADTPGNVSREGAAEQGTISLHESRGSDNNDNSTDWTNESADASPAYISLEEYLQSDDRNLENEREVEKAEEELTESLLEWYDLWQETHEQ